MRLATSGVEFCFDDVVYRQVDDAATGSPLGPALANICVGYYERRIPDDESVPPMCFCFVDNVFSYFVNQGRSVDFFKRVNNLHPALCFTQEEEQNKSLPFMDVRVTSAARGILTFLCRKPTLTWLYAPWDRFSPTLYKLNVVLSLTYRFIRICSPLVIDDETSTLQTVWLKNGYLGYLLEKLIKRDRPESRFAPRLCPLIFQVPCLGKAAEWLVSKANNAISVAYFAGKD